MQAVPGGTGQTAEVYRPVVSPGGQSGRTLSRVGRSYATTTATAGLPHPAYLDNVRGGWGFGVLEIFRV
jgi:hypothetical protein